MESEKSSKTRGGTHTNWREEICSELIKKQRLVNEKKQMVIWNYN